MPQTKQIQALLKLRKSSNELKESKLHSYTTLLIASAYSGNNDLYLLIKKEIAELRAGMELAPYSGPQF